MILDYQCLVGGLTASALVCAALIAAADQAPDSMPVITDGRIVESAGAKWVSGAPSDIYVRALLEAITHGALPSLEGEEA